MQLCTIIIRSTGFPWTQLNLLFLPRFHSDYFLLQRRKDLVPTLNKLADSAVIDPRRAGSGSHILEGDFRAFQYPRTLGLLRPRRGCLRRHRSNNVSPKECHAHETEYETRSCEIVSSHTHLLLEPRDLCPDPSKKRRFAALGMKNDRYQYDTGDDVIGQPDEAKHHHAFHEQSTKHPSAAAIPDCDVMA